MINKKFLLLYSLIVFFTAVSMGQGTVTRSKNTKDQSTTTNSLNQGGGVNKKNKSTNNNAKRDAIIQDIINNMVYVEGGSFIIGSENTEPTDTGKQVHQERVESFLIGKYEITQKEWQAVMGENSKVFLYEGHNLPASYLSWNDCNKFIRKLNILSGKNFRLPTEQEWEYAARGGRYSQGYKYSGGNNISNVAWYIDNSKNKQMPVGSKDPNELGIFDMSGGVYEWTSSTDSIFFIFRGGSISSEARECTVSARSRQSRNWAATFLGFRLALDK